MTDTFNLKIFSAATYLSCSIMFLLYLLLKLRVSLHWSSLSMLVIPSSELVCACQLPLCISYQHLFVIPRCHNVRPVEIGHSYWPIFIVNYEIGLTSQPKSIPSGGGRKPTLITSLLLLCSKQIFYTSRFHLLMRPDNTFPVMFPPHISWLLADCFIQLWLKFVKLWCCDKRKHWRITLR